MTVKRWKIMLMVLLAIAVVGISMTLVLLIGNKTKLSDPASSNGLFAGNEYELDSDYTLSGKDVGGKVSVSGKVMTVKKACSINLNGHTLDLGGYTLKIVSDTEGSNVSFRRGTLSNGALDISVPNADIDLDGVTFADDLTYTFEAASETIRIKNSRISGTGTIVSNTHVKVESSNMGNVTLDGNATLSAGNNSEFKGISVSKESTGASISIAATAKVQNVELSASASVNVKGTVTNVTVKEDAKSSSGVDIQISATATVDSVKLDAAANVDLSGTVSSLTVSETAKNDQKQIQVTVNEGADVAKVDIQSAASVEVSGRVSQVVVGQNAASDNQQVELTVTQTADVNKVDLSGKASVTVDGKVDNVAVNESATGTQISLNENANVAQVAVAAEDTAIAADGATTNVYVADNVTVETELETTTKSEDEMTALLKAHSHVYVVSERVDATCTEGGRITYTCVDENGNCEERSKVIYFDPLGHNYVYMQINETLGRNTCTRCGHTEDVEIETPVDFNTQLMKYLADYLGEGTFVIDVTGKYNYKTHYSYSGSENQDVTVDIKKFEVIIQVVDSKLKGTIDINIKLSNLQVYRLEKTNFNMVIKGKIDGEKIIVSISDVPAMEGNATIQTTFTAALNAILASLMPSTGNGISTVDKEISNYALNLDGQSIFGMIASYLPGLTDKLVGVDVFGSDAFGYVEDFMKLIGKQAEPDSYFNVTLDQILSSVFTITENNGVKTYTLDANAYNSFKQQKVLNLVENVIGEGKYASLKNYAEHLTEKTVLQVMLDLYNEFASENVSSVDFSKYIDEIEDAVYELIAKIFEYADEPENTVGDDIANEVAQQSEGAFEFSLATDKEQFKSMIGSYLNSTVGELLVTLKYGNISDPDEKAILLQIVNEIVNDYIEKTDEFVNKTLGDFIEDNTNNKIIKYVFATGNKCIFTRLADGKVDSFDVSVAIPESGYSNLKLEIKKQAGSKSFTFTVKDSASLINISSTVTVGEKNLSSTTATTVYTPYNEVTGNLTEKFGVYTDKNVNNTLFASVKDVEIGNLVFNNTTVNRNNYDGNGTDIYESYSVVSNYIESPEGNYFKITYKEYRVHAYNLLTTNSRKIYSGNVYSKTSEVIIPVRNGVFDALFGITPVCGDWICINIVSGYPTVSEYENIGGRFTFINGEVEFIDTDWYNSDVRNNNTGSGQVYYNPKTNQYAANVEHSFVPTKTSLVNPSEGCYGGVKTVYTCSVCGKTYVDYDYGHTYVNHQSLLATPCLPYYYFGERECSVCGHIESEQNTDTLWHYHRFIANENDDNTYDKRDLTANDALLIKYVGTKNLSGFISGSASRYVCEECGAALTMINYCRKVDGICKLYYLDIYSYQGNAEYDAFDQVIRKSVYTEHNNVEYEAITDKDKIQTMLSVYVGLDNIPFIIDYDNCKCSKEYCTDCGHIFEASYVVADSTSNNTLMLNLRYDENGDAYIDSLKIFSNVLSKVKTIAGKKFAKYLNGFNATAASMVIGDDDYYYYGSTPTYYLFTIGSNAPTLSNDNDYYYSKLHDEFKQFVKNGGRYVFIIDYGTNATVYVSTQNVCELMYYSVNFFTYKNNVFTATEHIETIHNYEEELIHAGSDCIGEGRTYRFTCRDCGNSYEYTEKNHLTRWISKTLDKDVANYLVSNTDSLNGLNAYIEGNVCRYGDSHVMDAKLILNADWVLTSDVYIIAEEIDIILNNYNIDLNGYRLIIYSENHQRLRIVSYEGYEPSDNPDFWDDEGFEGDEGEPAMQNTIFDSQGTGLLVLCSDGGYVGINNVAIDCNYNAIDNRDSRYLTLKYFADVA